MLSCFIKSGSSRGLSSISTKQGANPAIYCKFSQRKMFRGTATPLDNGTGCSRNQGFDPTSNHPTSRIMCRTLKPNTIQHGGKEDSTTRGKEAPLPTTGRVVKSSKNNRRYLTWLFVKPVHINGSSDGFKVTNKTIRFPT